MKHFISLTILVGILLAANAQSGKRPMTQDDILKWNRISAQKITNNGEFIIYKTEPVKGDPTLHLVNKQGDESASFPFSARSEFSFDSGFLVFTIQPPADTIRQLKLKKTKKDDMPGNKLGIYNLVTSALDTIHDIKSYKLPSEWGGWIAWQEEQTEGQGTEGEEKEEGEKVKEDKDKKKEKKESSKNGYCLNLKNLNQGDTVKFPFVTQYEFAEEKPILLFISTGDDKEINPGVYRYDLESGKKAILITGEGEYKQLSLDKEGNLIAFLADTTDVKEDKKQYSLYLWQGSDQASEIVSPGDPSIPEGWELSANGRITFSESGKRMFFGTSPIKPEKDTTVLEEELPQLDIWHWKEPVLQTQQLNSKSRDMNKTYMAFYDLKKKISKQLVQDDFTGIRLLEDGDADYALEYSLGPYALQSMWEGGSNYDISLLNIKTGEKEIIRETLGTIPQSSPGGKYLYWYHAMDSSWYTYKIDTRTEYRITQPGLIQCANEISDVPDIPGSYGSAGWLKDDAALLINDRFDVWQVDPENKKEPVNLTVNGRQNNINYRLLDLERQSRGRSGRGGAGEGFDPADKYYITGHNEITREDGYYSWSLKEPNIPAVLFSGEYNLGTPVKAKDADLVIFTLENFEIFPDLLLTDTGFKAHKKISDANPFQKDFIWGTAELVSWTSLDGRKLEGTLHKPENFDPSKKYPMIVNFYEKSSQSLYSHKVPDIGRSTIDYHYYTSNGYLVFNPDVYYKEGYPGEDAFNCVMPGVTALIEKGFVDEKHIGAQGHSWGGYQVAYLATRTNMFAAIESGAPVVNMFSAYGGIRWGSGLNRSFQYEHSQSRIGKSIWEAPLRYLENSPIFTMDKVQTPILIMHNDDDGAVPWYQGIEYFIALRRMGKPAWLLNYNNADHWPTRFEDRYDFQIRMAQFFDHYLKGEPMPIWMKEGIPAVKKGVEFGYDLVK